MSTLDQFRKYVSEQYQTVLGLKLTENVANDSQPVWLPDGDQAWLLDDEIGLAMRVVPYNDAQDDLNTAIQHAIRTATQLQPRYEIKDGEADRCGIWQVSICWLVDSTLREDWRKAIASIRKESGFSEEVGLDAILVEDGKDFSAACARHGLPQLLLHTRRIFQLKWTEMPSWLSANARVAEMLKTFPNQFSNDVEAYGLASELVRMCCPMIHPIPLLLILNQAKHHWKKLKSKTSATLSTASFASKVKNQAHRHTSSLARTGLVKPQYSKRSAWQRVACQTPLLSILKTQT